MVSTEDIEVPELMLNEGTNTISVDTSVAPSKMEITYMSK